MKTKEKDVALSSEEPEEFLLQWPGRHGDLLVRRDILRRADELASKEYERVLKETGSCCEANMAWCDRFMFYYKARYEDL